MNLHWWSALLAFFGTMLAMWGMVRIAPRLDLLDHPEGRKDHVTPTPVVGGVAMALACVAVLPLVGPLSSNIAAFCVAALIVVVIGVADDRKELGWSWRLGWQVVAGLVIAIWGDARVEELGSTFGVDGLKLGIWSVPFTVFVTVGLINALNMIDGADGLAGSLAWVGLAMFGAAALYAGSDSLAERVLVVCGALAGFLVWNLRFPWRARALAFMGDAGSGLLGLIIAWVALRLTQNASHPVSPVLALWLVPIPVMDCLVLIVRRLQERRSPFAAGRDHIHHIMADAGYSPIQIVGWLVLFSLLTGALVAQGMLLDVPNPLLLALYLLMCLGWYLLTRNRDNAVALFRRVHRGRAGESGILSTDEPRKDLA